MSKQNIHIVNKRASYEYILLAKYTAGMQLMGSEIKSIREGNVNISDAFCFFKAHKKDGTEELYVRNMNIGTFKQASHYNHDTMRVRKLLLKKGELRKLKSKAAEKGLTIVPLKIFISETGYAKIEIAIGQGKKSYDKRESIKERDVKRDMAAAAISCRHILLVALLYMLHFAFNIFRLITIADAPSAFSLGETQEASPSFLNPINTDYIDLTINYLD